MYERPLSSVPKVVVEERFDCILEHVESERFRVNEVCSQIFQAVENPSSAV